MDRTLLFRSIRSDTIIKYLNAVAVFPIPQGLQNPTYDKYGKRTQYIDRVIKEVRRRESMPNHREILTNEMAKYIQDKGK